MKRWMLIGFALLTMLLVVASPTAMAQGNSANARDCQKGGWVTLARDETPGIAFVSQRECVNYGAQGGKIVPLVVTPRLTITVTAVYGEYDVAVTITGVGLVPDSVVEIERTPGSGDFRALAEGRIVVGQNGTITDNLQFFYSDEAYVQCGEASLIRGLAPSGAYVYATLLFDC